MSVFSDLSDQSLYTMGEDYATFDPTMLEGYQKVFSQEAKTTIIYCEEAPEYRNLQYRIFEKRDIESLEEIRIEILDNKDVGFFVICVINSRDFQKLAQENSLHVEFGNFAQSIIDLINKCNNDEPAKNNNISHSNISNSSHSNSNSNSKNSKASRNVSPTSKTANNSKSGSSTSSQKKSGQNYSIQLNINEDYSAKVKFLQMLRLRAVEVFSLDFESAPNEFIRAQIQHRFNQLKMEVQSRAQEFEMKFDRLKSKNPQLADQVYKTVMHNVMFPKK
ncbi:hypothetical protein TRFO_23670 [Tritrichomonas foetus]|uniref:Spindle assembly abnormal protein 6 N-terminal domain-containing protein n=1 Tax=Tritrichomonas foetus TaxID=1144522 RepID=A0A1J4KE94_9EUKA|nr:hypothetical protein TRFO_23670 [Tritrichomonas foetus]|eukprot:OHT08036.1 hypothetical protein TRFO_23670 [Tritrichomonas foetus]